MDFHKLKLETFNTYDVINEVTGFSPPLTRDSNPDVFFCFVSSIHDVMNVMNVIQNKSIKKENRIIFVFRKGTKGFNRDHLYNVVMSNNRFKRKAPMLASLDKTYSVFTFLYEV